MDWQQLIQEAIYFDDVYGVPGTTWPIGTQAVPSDVAADVKTMCVARHLRNIHVHGTFTVPSIMEHFCWYGAEHEDITDQLNLNSQDVDGCNATGLIVTGTQAGTGFLTLIRCLLNALLDFQGRADFCDIYGSTIRLKDGGYADFLMCNSVHGVLTVTVQAPTRASFKEMSGNLTLTAQDGGVCFVRGFKGTLVIDAMTAGALGIYANGAGITINPNCTGGTINIYGNARVTGAGGGVAIIDLTIDKYVHYTEDSASGTTVNAWADALDVDTRGMKSMSMELANTHGANSLNWRLRCRYADYAAGTDEEIVEAPGEETLTFGTKGLATLLKAYSRIKVQVQSTVGGSHATYTLTYLINR